MKWTQIRRAGAVVMLCGALTACGSAATSAGSTDTSSSTSSTGVAASAAPSSAATTASSAAATSAAKLDLNTVTEQQLLATIPSFPSRMVREFMEYRPYVSIQQYRKEIGKYVSADQVSAWEQYIYVPVDVNAADAATLQQLPGVDATIADALIAARPYASNAAFLTKLGQSVAADQVAAASAYLAAQ